MPSPSSPPEGAFRGRVLLIHGAAGAARVARGEGGALVALATGVRARGGSQELPGLLEQALGGGPRPDAVAVILGPGSFTGIKVAIAFARGFARAAGRPLGGVDGLEALAAAAGPGEHLAAVDALRGELYGRRFRVAPGAPPEALAEAALMEAGPSSLPGDLVMEGPGVSPGARAIPSEALLAAGLGLLAAGRVLPVAPIFTRRSWAESP